MIDRRRVVIFCAIALAIAGSAALYLALTGGLAAHPGRSLLVLAVWYMPAPALAHLLTRLLTREGWHDLYLHPRFRRGWPMWLAAWLLPGLLVIAGALLYFALFPQEYGGMAQVAALLGQLAEQTGRSIPLTPALYVLVQIGQAFLIAPVVNALPTLGEEFGWRAYLQPKLLPLGWRRAMLWMGLIWGVWHWPVLALGYNYGLEYPGAPWLGMLVFLWFTLTVGTLLGWVTLRGGSVWPAVIGHGALNGMANLPSLFVQSVPQPLLGPFAVGLIGGLGFALVGVWLWWAGPGVTARPAPPPAEP